MKRKAFCITTAVAAVILSIVAVAYPCSSHFYGLLLNASVCPDATLKNCYYWTVGEAAQACNTMNKGDISNTRPCCGPQVCP